jgi:hypothetical protein
MGKGSAWSCRGLVDRVKGFSLRQVTTGRFLFLFSLYSLLRNTRICGKKGHLLQMYDRDG